MVTWKQFAESDPELAALGQGQLFQFGVGLAFLATVRKDGAPRLHPLCPVLYDSHLYIFVPQSSPKREDLLRDGRFAMQAFPPPKEESEEFYMTGKAVMVSNEQLWKVVRAATKSMVREGETLFELFLERTMYTVYENWGTPDLKPVHRMWRA